MIPSYYLCRCGKDCIRTRALLAGIKEGAVLIDLGTSISDPTRKIGAELALKGAAMIYAPLGLTPAHAKDGLLNIMAAGNLETFIKLMLYYKGRGRMFFT